MTSDDTDECPLCMEPFEVDDMSFYPCTCGYQICRFCWHRLKIDGNGLCPACRKPYSENPAHFEPLSEDEIIRIKKERRHKEVQKKQKLSENRRHLADVRVVQKNLVFVVGLSQRLADAEVLKKIEYFGKFGKIMKVVINSSPSYAGTQTPSASAYLTYSKPDEALKAIQTVNNIQIDNRVLKASLGTTKYCSHFLKGIQCPKVDCMYLHDLGEEAASFTKEQMSQGKHLDYESKLIECILHIPRNLQNISTTTITPGTTTTANVENNNTNQLGFISQTNTLIPGTTTAAATALTTAPSASVSIIPPPVTSTTPPIVQNSVSPVSNLTTNTVTHSSSTSNTNNQENKGESIKSKPKLKSTSSSSNRTDKTVSAVVASASTTTTTTALLIDNKPDENIVNDSDEVLIDKEEDIINRNRKYNTTLEESDADFTNYLSSKTYNNNENINLDLTSTNNNILNGRLDNVLLNGFSTNTALQQEEDLGFDPWGESTKALQDLMKMEKVTTTDQLENYENLLYLKAQSLNQNFLSLKLSSNNNHHQHQDYNNSINSNGNSSHTIDENRHNHPLFHRSLNGQHFDEKSSTSSSSSLSLKSNDPVKLNPSLYNNSLPLTNNKTQQQQLNNRESLNDAMFQNSILMNNSNISSSTGHFTSNFNNNSNNNENSEYYNNNNNQESYLNKILLKNNLSKVIVPPPGFNNTATTSVNNNTTTFNSPISTSSTNSSSSSTSSSVNNSTSTTPSLNLNLINQAKQIANAYQINDLKKINESVARNLKNKENDCSKLLTDVNDYSAQDRSNKNSFNLNNDENLINTQTNKLNISNLQETFRQIFPNAHISFGAASPAINNNNNNNNNNNHQQASNFQNNKNQYIIDEQLLKQNCWPDDPAIVSLNGGINDCNIQRLANEKIQQDSLNNMFMNQNQPDLSFLTNSSQANNSLNFNNLLRKQTEQQQMNTSLLNQFQMLYQQHQLAQLNALKNKQAQTLKTNQAINTNINNNNNNNNNNLNGNYFQNMSSNLNNINAIYNNHNSNLLDNYISGVNDVNSFNTTNNTNMNNYYVIDSNQNIQTTNLNKNNLSVSSLSLPQQNFMQQFISSITPNSNGE